MKNKSSEPQKVKKKRDDKTKSEANKEETRENRQDIDRLSPLPTKHKQTIQEDNTNLGEIMILGQVLGTPVSRKRRRF
ncbi:MAG: hypothetical protein ATN35_09530 [Epulopiscium sp. Nele67-Bin004]|nr:MAG: hypothetical protein ATN35_09530 [Epulopiscium sp. Nele67-Bin004]